MAIVILDKASENVGVAAELGRRRAADVDGKLGRDALRLGDTLRLSSAFLRAAVSPRTLHCRHGYAPLH